ncbi:MAG TPA: class I SAM-dependent methyltransferase [Oscillatoriaceae cyanobacterium]
MNVEPYQIVSCVGCGLSFLSPRPDDDEFTKLYGKSYFTDHLESSNLLGASEDVRERLIANKAFLLDYVLAEQSIGTLLEIGCATGYFLELARRSGFSIKGIEFSNDAAESAHQLTGAPIHIGDVASAIASGFVRDAEFDAIMMSHVLEHVKSPKQELNLIRRILKPGGIAVIRLPDFGSWNARLAGPAWEGLRLPFHLYHFTPKTLRRYFDAADLEVVQFDYWIDGSIAAPLLKLRRQLVGSGGPQPTNAGDVSAPVRTVPTHPGLLKMLLYPFRGRTMTFVVRKA